MEMRFGHDFGRVRVHTDARAGESARAVHALAYTVGSNVVFAPGQYSETERGMKLLSHELTHVLQQGDHAFPGGGPISIQSPNDHFEQQAEATAARFQAGATPLRGSMPSRLPRGGLQRFAGEAMPRAGGCSGWMEDRESTTKRAAEVYVRAELTEDHGQVESVDNCSPEARRPADFACSVRFSSGLTTRVLVSWHTIIVGVEPLNALGPGRPICYYDFACPEPNRDLVLTKRKCVTKLPKPAP
jgi:hypothetical protein